MENTNSKAAVWTGRTLSGLAVAFLLLDGVMKLFTPAPVVEGMTRLGYPVSESVGIGIVLLACVTLYAIPRTSFLGAILLTGYLGGATASTLRAGDPSYIFPPLLGVLIWGGLYLRDRRVRALMPLRAL